jgi:hypothetical protein
VSASALSQAPPALKEALSLTADSAEVGCVAAVLCAAVSTVVKVSLAVVATHCAALAVVCGQVKVMMEAGKELLQQAGVPEALAVVEQAEDIPAALLSEWWLVLHSAVLSRAVPAVSGAACSAG